jgi:hypothetical protein
LGKSAPGRGAEDFYAHAVASWDDRWAVTRDYSSALAYELTSQFNSISSC